MIYGVCVCWCVLIPQDIYSAERVVSFRLQSNSEFKFLRCGAFLQCASTIPPSTKHTPPVILTNKSRSTLEIYLTTLSISHSLSLRRQSRRMSHLKLCTRCCATNSREDSENPFIHLFSRSQTTKRFREIWSEGNEFLTIQP